MSLNGWCVTDKVRNACHRAQRSYENANALPPVLIPEPLLGSFTSADGSSLNGEEGAFLILNTIGREDLKRPHW